MRKISNRVNMKLALLFPGILLLFVSCAENINQFSGKIEYSIKNYRIVSSDCDTSGRCAYVEFRYPHFSGRENNLAVTTLNSYVLTALLADDYSDSAASTIDELGNKFVEEYENFVTEFNDYSIGWALEREINVIHKDSVIISLEFYEYSFMGGAHPNTAKTYQSFYLNNAGKVVISDSSVIEKLTSIAEKEFRRLKNIPDDKALSKAGYWFENDEFHLNDNFAITDEGIVFYFNPYEIGPYSLGGAKIILSREQVGDLISKILKKER